jgi:phosphoglycerate kinase
VPTLKALADAGAKVVVTAHLGRPKGGPDPKYSLAPVAAALGDQLGRHVQLAGDVVGADALARAEGLTDGDVLLLENIRFDPRETSKDDAERLALAKALAELVAGADGSPVRSCPTASESCTASRPPYTTSPPCCRTTQARWWRPR